MWQLLLSRVPRRGLPGLVWWGWGSQSGASNSPSYLRIKPDGAEGNSIRGSELSSVTVRSGVIWRVGGVEVGLWNRTEGLQSAEDDSRATHCLEVFRGPCPFEIRSGGHVLLNDGPVATTAFCIQLFTSHQFTLSGCVLGATRRTGAERRLSEAADHSCSPAGSLVQVNMSDISLWIGPAMEIHRVVLLGIKVWFFKDFLL